MADPGAQPTGGLQLHSARGRWVIAATVLGAGIVMIDGGEGTLDEPLSAVLTANLGYLTEALDAAAR